MIKAVNSISGGKTSSYLAAQYPADYEVFSLVCLDDVRCKPKDKSLIQYVNAKLENLIPKYGEFIATAEDDLTLYAMRDLEQFLGREIIWVRGVSFDNLLQMPKAFGGKPSRLPSWARRYCTLEMKLLPIFDWWFNYIGEKVNMRIGFRADEWDRMENFFNSSNKTEFRIPVACSTKGKRLQRHETFNWRNCKMPLVRDGLTQEYISDWWDANGYVGTNSLFDKRRKIVFPEISNCIFCFHKHPDTLTIEWQLNPEKMQWASEKENIGKGTWHDNKVPYADLPKLLPNYTVEMLRANGSCDSGGCTD